MTQQLDIMFAATCRQEAQLRSLGERPAAPLRSEAEKRDDVLAALAERRSEAVRLGIETARALCRAYPEGITAADVQRAMEAKHADVVAGIDPRYLGAVLLPSTGFERTGEMRPTGSKARHQPCWRLRP